MKKIILVILMSAGMLQGAYNPAMRIHFGASNAIVRLQAGYFTHTGQNITPGEGINKPPSVFDQMRLNGEALLMVNNRFRFQESVMRNAPRFLLAKVMADGPEKFGTASLSFAQGLPCISTLPFFGQIKGYWSVGAAVLRDSREETVHHAAGGRAGFNCYSKNAALQSEISVFENTVLCHVIVYRKIGEHLMLNTGVEHNRPLAGVCVLAGNFRFALSSRLMESKVQHGFSLTGNF